MMKAVTISEHGTVDVFKYGDVPKPSEPGVGQVLIKIKYTSINYIDTYHRSGLYKLQNYPAILGRDGVGIVEAVGNDVDYVKVGDRVAFVALTAPQGTYAEFTTVSASNVVKIPDELGGESDEKAICALMLQGLTSHYLVCSTRSCSPNDWVLIHAGAGGCGTIAIQIAKARGLNVITTVSNEEKVKIVTECGADVIINSSTCTDIAGKVREVTNGKGVALVLDGVGQSTYESSMKSAQKRGTVVFFGNASGPVPPINPLSLTSHGSIFITRPTLNDYIQDHEEFLFRCNDLLNMMKNKQLRAYIHHEEFTLEQIPQAHECIESRRSIGKIIIRVSDEKQ